MGADNERRKALPIQLFQEIRQTGADAGHGGGVAGDEQDLDFTPITKRVGRNRVVYLVGSTRLGRSHGVALGNSRAWLGMPHEIDPAHKKQ